MATKTYTDIDYSNMACQANAEGKKLVKVEKEEQIPIYDEEGQIIGYETVIYEDLEIVDFSEEEKRQQLDLLSLTKREVFLALLDDKGITPEQLRSQITNERAKIEFDYAESYFRGNPLINSIGAMLGYTTEQLDCLFKYKSFTPPPEPEPEPTEEPELEEGAEE